MNLRWVPRNEDKPHRCPSCHGVAERSRLGQGHDHAGPRTVMACPNNCGVRWRYGRRYTRTQVSRFLKVYR